MNFRSAQSFCSLDSKWVETNDFLVIIATYSQHFPISLEALKNDVYSAECKREKGKKRWDYHKKAFTVACLSGRY